MTRFLLIFIVMSASLISTTVSLATVDGRIILAEIPSEGPTGDFVQELNSFLDANDTRLDQPTPEVMSNSGTSSDRDYYREVLPEEEKDIQYLILSMANKAWPQLWMQKKWLDQAGYRITHIHPLRFLLHIFTHEPLKVGIRNIRKNGKIWSRFSEDLLKNLKEEYDLNNLTMEQLQHFVNETNLPNTHLQQLTLPYQEQKWPKLVDNMIKYIPRQGNWDRYRMRFADGAE